MHLETQEIMKGSEVFKGKFWVEFQDKFLNETCKGTTDDNVVYVNQDIVELVPHVWMKREGSHLLPLNPNLISAEANLSNQALGACFKPYKALCNLHTKLDPLQKPSGCVIYTSSWRMPLRKALLTSNWRITQFWDNAKLRTTRMVAGLTTGEKVSE